MNVKPVSYQHNSIRIQICYTHELDCCSTINQKQHILNTANEMRNTTVTTLTRKNRVLDLINQTVCSAKKVIVPFGFESCNLHNYTPLKSEYLHIYFTHLKEIKQSICPNVRILEVSYIYDFALHNDNHLSLDFPDDNVKYQIKKLQLGTIYVTIHEGVMKLGAQFCIKILSCIAWFGNVTHVTINVHSKTRNSGELEPDIVDVKKSYENENLKRFMKRERRKKLDNFVCNVSSESSDKEMEQVQKAFETWFKMFELL